MNRGYPLGFIGFSHVQGKFFAHSMHVRGKRVIHVPIPYPLYIVLNKLFNKYHEAFRL